MTVRELIYYLKELNADDLPVSLDVDLGDLRLSGAALPLEGQNIVVVKVRGKPKKVVIKIDG